MHYSSRFFFTLLILFCGFPFAMGQSGTTPSAQAIVDQAIAYHGGDRYLHSSVAFDFRGTHYTAQRNQGQFTYIRSMTKEGMAIVDRLENGTFSRLTNGQPAELTEKKIQAYSNSLNSVIYFALLPYALNDAAVRKAYKGVEEMEGRPHHKVEVTFVAEGGGDDFEDVFHYWMDAETHQVNYLAYRYHTNGGGLRFRKAYNTRNVGGIVFSDYVNYKASPELSMKDLPKLFHQGKLTELSRIDLENISVDVRP